MKNSGKLSRKFKKKSVKIRPRRKYQFLFFAYSYGDAG